MLVCYGTNVTTHRNDEMHVWHGTTLTVTQLIIKWSNGEGTKAVCTDMQAIHFDCYSHLQN